MAPAAPAYNVDWIFSTSSNVHVANDRDWFTTYTAFPTRVGTYINGAGVEVLGIGDVELEVRKVVGEAARKRRGRKTSTIILRDVLYAPGYICNVVGSPISHDYGLILDFGTNCGYLTNLQTKATVGLLDMTTLLKLWLKGQAKGQSSLDPRQEYMINAIWSEGERRPWKLSKSEGAPSQPQDTIAARTESWPYTAEEKRWLKDNYRGEFHFLMAHGLSVYKEEDREEGRRIARALMDGSDDPLDDDSLESNDVLADLEADPMSHLADRFFSEEELVWIQKHYRHSGNFLLAYGLKPYNDEDCEEGLTIIQAFMTDDD